MPLHRNESERGSRGYDEGNAIGLTRAFSPISEDAPEGRLGEGCPVGV